MEPPAGIEPARLRLSKSFAGADDGSRTHDPRFTKAVLWPAELHRLNLILADLGRENILFAKSRGETLQKQKK